MNRAAPEPAARTPLGVVIPAYNEGDWVRRAVSALHYAADRAGWAVEVVVVDDGSTDPASTDTLDDLAETAGVHVLRQPNRGRFAARLEGLRALGTEYVLLLDSRVEVDPPALERLAALVGGPDTDVWNFDVTPGSRDPRALFWTGITKVWWRSYFVDRRRVSFGLADFDRYPKGTGAFFAPRDLLLEAAGEFSSLFARAELASDDTRLLREVARRHPINLAPEVACRHHAKAGWPAWLRQCFFRGTTFVDGYLDEPGRALPMLVAGGVASTCGVALTVGAPRVAAALVVTGSVAAGVEVRRAGGTTPEAASVVALAPAFGMFFGVALARGLWYAGRSR